MTLEDKMGHVGYILLVIAALAIGAKQIWGWPVYLVADLIWLWVGIRIRMTSVWFWTAIFLVVHSVGLYNWAVV